MNSDTLIIANWTNAWLLAKVLLGLTMDGEIVTSEKVLIALVAAKGFLAHVRSTMDGEIAALGEAPTALVAAEGFLA